MKRVKADRGSKIYQAASSSPPWRLRAWSQGVELALPYLPETGVAAAVAVSVGNVEEAIEARCDALARRGQFLRTLSVTDWPDGTVSAQYAFRHTLFQEIVYERVPVSRRVRWHRQIGARLEKGYGLQARELAAKLAEHFMRGREPWRALQYLQYAGENALRRSAHQEAIPRLRQRLALLSSLLETPVRAQ